MTHYYYCYLRVDGAGEAEARQAKAGGGVLAAVRSLGVCCVGQLHVGAGRACV